MRNEVIMPCVYFLLMSILPFHIFSQTAPDIKKSGNYYWGEGSGNHLEQADKNALADLISQISVQVESEMKNVMTEKDGNFREFSQSVTKTYSSATLDRAMRMILQEDEDGVKVLRYISKEQMQEVFTDRRDKIFDYIKTAIKAEKELRIGDALKYFFWSLSLLRSHPDCNRIKYKLDGEEESVLLPVLSDKIVTMLSGIGIKATNIKNTDGAKEITLQFSYKNQTVQNADFMYWTGETWTHPSSAKNGNGWAELYGNNASSISSLKVRIEYRYTSNSRIDLELHNVMENTPILNFRQAEFKVPLDVTPTEKVQVLTQDKKESLGEIDPARESRLVERAGKAEQEETYVGLVEKIKSAVAFRNYSSVKMHFTQEGYSMFEKLMTGANVKILDQSKPLQTLKVNGSTVVRSVPMHFAYKKNNRTFVDELNFEFDSLERIKSVSFSLGGKAISDILEKRADFGTLEERYQLIHFMEHYKTAYCLGRMDFLEKVFSDDALIIVGHSLTQKNAAGENRMPVIDNDKLQYIRMTKKEYLEKLRKVFTNNEFVNIHFDENTVFKPKKNSKLYAINIAQNWYSSNYADKGYLFLAIDMNDPVKPSIFIRTWEPTNRRAKFMDLGDWDF
jgi:hypothetical protein